MIQRCLSQGAKCLVFLPPVVILHHTAFSCCMLIHGRRNGRLTHFSFMHGLRRKKKEPVQEKLPEKYVIPHFDFEKPEEIETIPDIDEVR